MPRMTAEEELAFQLQSSGFPPFEQQYQYAEGRKLRADFAFPEHKLLVEVQGGVWTRQAHGSVTGVLKDIDRLNAATLAGFYMLRFTPEQVTDGTALSLIDRVLHG